jgi:glutaredoxin
MKLLFYSSEKVISMIMFLFLFSITISSYFFGVSCGTSGCKAASQLIIIPEIYLNVLGAVFFLFLYLLSVFNYEKLYKIILLSGLLFESILYSFQIKQGIFCPICFTVIFSILFLTFFKFKLKQLYVFLIPFTVFSAVYLLNFSEKNNFTFENEFSLISYSECSHCKKVKDYLHANAIEFKNIDIKEVKGSLSFLKHFKFEGIPVLIVRNSEKDFRILYGDSDILEYFDRKRFTEPSFYDIQPAEESGGCMLVNPKCN